MHARYYSSGWGRFLSVDPVLGDRKRPQSWNRCGYVENNPLNATDPTGEQAAITVWCGGCLAPIMPSGFGSEQSVLEFLVFLKEHASKSAWMRQQMQVMRLIGQGWSMNPDDAFLSEYGAALRRSKTFGECGSDLECGQSFVSLVYSSGAANGKGLTGNFHFAVVALAKKGLDPKRASRCPSLDQGQDRPRRSKQCPLQTKNGDIVSRETGEVIGNLFGFQ